MSPRILVLNCGSSSLKYAVFEDGAEETRGAIDRIGSGGAVGDHAAAVTAVLDAIARLGLESLDAVGHRIVHGGPDHLEPERVTDAVLESLARATPFAPLHLPAELATIAAVRARFGELPQVVCFDTTFHRSSPAVAQHLPLPSWLFESGVRRYGFHGLSYEGVVETLGPAVLRRAILAHLGNGASLVAVRDGVALETTMGFTPAGGLVMGTRPGDLDPGVILYLLEQGGYDAARLGRLLNHEAGLLALSGTSSDMRALLSRRAEDPRAALAVDVFCHQAKKGIGALAAVLGGLDTLVFTGGIGQHAPEVRSQICRGLGHLGVRLDEAANERNASRMGAGTCHVEVVAADEERVIARRTARLLEGAREGNNAR